MKTFLTLALLIAITPASAAINAAQNPLLVVHSTTVTVELPVIGNQRAEQLPSECRGYYARPHKQTGLSRCN
jgi:hypothetical protein